jgi:ribosomal protein S13
MNNKYIGARYVPKFGGDWDSSKSYEPLVIVCYQGNSYTSKTYVPSGTDINNLLFWALTGNYNAQVEYYRQEVNALKTAYAQQFENIAVKPETYGAKGDGITDDTDAIQEAIDYANSRGTHVVALTAGRVYIISRTLVPRDNMQFICLGGKATITAHSVVEYGFDSDVADLSNLLFENIIFKGGCSDTDVYPRITVTSQVDSLNLGIHLYGDRLTADYPHIENVRILGCEFHNLKRQPLALCGISGIVEFNDNYMYNNFDAGFTDCEHMIVTNNYSVKSRDNGFSISRGDKNIVCNSNVIEDAGVSGIFIAGWEVTEFPNKIGPENFSCVGNVIKGCGTAGMTLKIAPKNGIVADNTIDTVYKGTVDNVSEYLGWGMLISGYVLNGNVESYAENLKVTGNLFLNCYRGGIKYNSVKGLYITDNIIVNCGQLNHLDGSAVVNTDKTCNIGILNDETTAGRVTNVFCHNNTVVDNRDIPVTNYPVISGTIKNSSFINNQSYGTRQPVIAGYTMVLANNNYFDLFKQRIQAVAAGDSQSVYVGADLQDYLRMAITKTNGIPPYIGIGLSTGFEVKKSDTENVNEATVFTPVFKCDNVNGVFYIKLGSYYIWYDNTANTLRTKVSIPASISDGTAIA